MKSLVRKTLRYATVALVLVLAVAYLSQLPDESVMNAKEINPSLHRTVAVFGGSGTAGDGVLKAVLADPKVEKVHIVTRRTTPRMEEGVASGKAVITTHMDYLDYSAMSDVLQEVYAVYWALGTSARNVSKEQYGVIHVDFPLAFVEAWLDAADVENRSFHYISGAGTSAKSSMHWAREKARAEQSLSARTEGTGLKVISYRPPYIAPTTEQSGFGPNLLHAVFSPIKQSLRATEIGQSMLEVTARGDEVADGAVLESKVIRAYSEAYLGRE